MSDANLIGELPRNAVEKLQVDVSHYKGSTLIDFRLYFETYSGEYRPTKKRDKNCEKLVSYQATMKAPEPKRLSRGGNGHELGRGPK